MADKSEHRRPSLRSRGSPAIQPESSESAPKVPLTLKDLNTALDKSMEKINDRIDALLDKRLSIAFEKFRQEIRADLMEEINRLKSIVDGQSEEIAVLKAEAQFNADQLHANVEALAKTTHHQMQKERAPYIIISGLPENSVQDSNKVKDVLDALDCTDSEITHSERIGKSYASKPRLLRIKFRNPSDKTKAVRNARRLRNDRAFDGIYVNPDLTFAERIERRRLHVTAETMRRECSNTDTRFTLTKGILYQDGIEIDRASPHRHLFRM